MAVKQINDRKREQRKARALAFVEGNRKERRSAAFSSKKVVAESIVTNELKAKAKKVKDTPLTDA